MLKKNLFIALLLTLAANHASAQVYTIHAKYSVESIYIHEYHQLSFDRIDTSNNFTLVADFDKKTVTDPTDSYSPLIITEIVHDEGSMFYILKVKSDKWVKWRSYKLMVNHQDQPVYIKDTDVKRDTFFHTYTNNLATLSFYQKTARIKDKTVNEDKFTNYNLTAELRKEKWNFTDNIVEMRDGYINWTTGGEKHVLDITEVYLLKTEGTDGLRVICTEKDGELYDINYLNSNRKIEENQYGKERFITIAKIVGSKRVWEAILL